MGFQKDPRARLGRRDRTLSLDESGQLSIDFMIGISIFLITLIIAATMISGLLVGLQSRTIDYDAVAYRTGVILVEDPGEPDTLFNDMTIDEISRFGLTLYKSTPRVLSQKKVDNFFNTPYSEIRERIIFGSYPYRFNVKIKAIDPPPPSPLSLEVGPDNPDIAYGYIRRVVLIKQPSSADISMNTYRPDGEGKFTVELNYLPNYVAPQYWIDPHKEEIKIDLTSIDSIKLNPLDPIRINSIRIEYYGLLHGTEVTGELPLAIEDYESDPDIKPPTDIGDSYSITFPTGYFPPSSPSPELTITKVNVIYEFEKTNIIPHEDMSTYVFGNPPLQPAVLEVRVW